MNLPKKAIIYISSLFIIALMMSFYLLVNYDISNIRLILFWSALGAIAESLLIVLPNGVAVSVLFAINLAAIITSGPIGAAIVSCISVICRVPKLNDRGYVHVFNTPFYKTLFNVSQCIILMGASGIIYVNFGGEIGKISISAIFLTILVYVFLNSAIMSTLISLINKQRFSSIWISSIKGTLINSIAIAVVGIIIVMAYNSYQYIAVLLFFAPLLLARYSFKLYVDMRNIYIETIQALNKTMEAKDPYTSGHALRVQDFSVRLAMAMELPERKIQNIKTAAILHDIGKIGVDDSILKKPGFLSKVEYSEIQKHASMGAEIIKDVDFLKDISQIIRCHHERFDGKGYPNGLMGAQIPIEASILAIADVYDAMTSNRPYRNALDMDTALNEIIINAGKQFEPAMAQKFYELMKV